MMVTALRGFALVPLLAPTSVAVAILTRELPGLSWSALLPFGLLCAAILLVVGWTMDNHRLHQLQMGSERPPTPAGELRRLLYGSLLGIALIALLASLTWLSATQAAMLLVPLAVIGLLLHQGGSPTAVYGEVRDTLAGMRNETFIFACSALLGGLTAILIPVERLAGHFSSTPLALFGLGAIGMLAIIALALLGVAPIISLSLCAALLAQLAGHGVAVMQPAVALLVGFLWRCCCRPMGRRR